MHKETQDYLSYYFICRINPLSHDMAEIRRLNTVLAVVLKNVHLL